MFSADPCGPWAGASQETALGAPFQALGSVLAEPSPSTSKCCSCCLGPKPTSADNRTENSAGAETHCHTDTQRSLSVSVVPGPGEQPTAGGDNQKATPASATSPADAFLAAGSGSYVKMASPAVPSSAGDLTVDSPSPVGQLTPPKVFLFPEVIVESASSASGLEVEEEAAPGVGPVPGLVVSSHGIAPGGSFPVDALPGPELTATGSQLLSPRRRLSRLRPVASGQLRPLSGLLSPRPAVSTPCRRGHSPHTPAVTAHLRPLRRPDVFFSGRVEARRRRLPPGGVPTSPSSLPEAGALDSEVQRRLALGSLGSLETMMIGASTPADPGEEVTRASRSR